MDILYRRGKASVGEVRADMEDAPSYSAVRALLAILESKGHARHEKQGSRFVYLPSAPLAEAAKSALAQLVRTFFAGDVEQVVATLVSDPGEKLTHDDLDRLAKLIADAKEGRS